MYFECLPVALVIQHAKRMCCILLSSMTCLVLPHFSTLYHRRYYYPEKKLLNIKNMF
jgi:hypothetical protein